MLLFFLILIILVMGPILFMQTERFGASPTGERLERMKKSPNYRDGKFQNLSHTPQLTEGHTIPEVIFDFLFRSNKRRSPKDKIPSVKTDLLNLPKEEDIMVWFGHSSYFM